MTDGLMNITAGSERMQVANDTPLSIIGYKNGLLRAACILLEGRLAQSTLAEITAKIIKEAEDAR